MKPRSRFLHFQHADVVRKIAVEIGVDFRRVIPAFGPELRHLTPSVHAGVRSAGAVNIDFLAGHTGENGFELVLDRVVCIALLLPAVVSGSVIGDDHTVILHVCLVSYLLVLEVS